MLSSYVCALVAIQRPETHAYDYVGKIGTQKATLVINWPKGSAHKLVPKLSGSLILGVKDEYFDVVGSNKTKGHVEFKIMSHKKSVGALRIMRDAKTPKIWTGEFYLPKQSPIGVRLKAMGAEEYGC